MNTEKVNKESVLFGITLMICFFFKLTVGII